MAVKLPKKLVVRDEATAFKYLEQALNDELGDEQVVLNFEHWPVLTIKLEGPGYDSTITPDIAESLVQLQHAMNRAYARAVRDTTNARTLTAQERRQLKFKAKVEKGSSLIKVDLGDYAQQLMTALAGRMESQHIVATVLGLALVSGGVLAYRSFLKQRSEDRKIEQETQVRVALSKEETRRAEVMAQALTAKPQLAFAQEDFDHVRREILRSTGEAKAITVQGVELSNAQARTIASTPRSESEDVQLNGHYVIQKIDWTNPEEVKLFVSSTDINQVFVATFKGGALSAEHRERLKSAEWDRRRVYMAINGTRLRGEITTASIINVEWPKDAAPPAA